MRAVDVVGDLAGQPVRRHAGVELLAQRFDALEPALRPHRATQQVGVLSRALADGHRHLHELLLEHRDAEGALQRRHELGVQVRDLLLPELAAHERVHGPALDRPRPHQRDLHDEVVELARLQARQQPHLGARLHLEDADRVGAAEHVVDRRLLFRQGRQLPLLAGRRPDHVEAVLQRRQHPETQQIELDQPHPGGVVFVPLDDGAVLHAGVLDRHHLADRAIGQHHAARVDAEVPRRLQQLHREVDDAGRDVVVVARRQLGAPALHLLRPGVLLAGGVPERLRHVAHRVLGPVLDDVGDLCGIAAPVLLEHPLDDLFAAIGVEVDVDVGLLVAQRRQEPLERQLVEDRVDRGDVEQVADRRVGGRAAALAEDALAAGEGDDVVHDQEVAGEVLGLDHGELGLDALPVGVGEVGVLGGHRIPDQLPQPRHRRVALGHLLLRQRGLGAAQRERELVGEGDGALDGSGIPGEPGAHLASRSQVRGARGRQPPVQLVEAAARAHGGDRGREVTLSGGGVVHVAGRDDGQPAFGGQRGQRVVVVGVERVAVVDELDVDVVAAEQAHELVKL